MEKKEGRTKFECADLVRKQEPMANGATWAPNGRCIAEFGATDSKVYSSWETCLFPKGQ